MNMKKNALIACFISSVFIVKAQADTGVIEGMPYTEKENIRLYADVNKKHSIEIDDNTPSAATGEWWTVCAYIQNAGKKRIRILLGHETNILIGQPDKKSINITYEISNESSISGIATKPPISDLRLVELDAGEIAQLPVANVHLKEKEVIKKCGSPIPLEIIFPSGLRFGLAKLR
jgi:hypothetical protein